MKYKIAKLTQLLVNDQIHVETIATKDGEPDDVIASAMQTPAFMGKTVATSKIWNDAGDRQDLVSITTEVSPVNNPDQYVFAYCCVPDNMDLTNGYQLEKLLDLQL